MKKKFRRFWIKDSGAVSIYAIIIILPIFILNALLIDSLRIISAEREIENAMDTALRSVMAQFNSDLAAYGLFAYGGSSASEDFENYVTKQIPQPGDLSGFQNLSTPSIENAEATFNTSRNLVDADVFRHQVIESTKYQAPVQMGKDIFELLFGGRNVSDEEVASVEELVEKYEEIIDLMHKRNDKIEKAREQLVQLTQIVKSDISTNIVGKKITSGDTIPKGIQTLNELLYYNNRYTTLIEKEKKTNDEKKEIENYEDSLNLEVYTSLFSAVVYYQDIPPPLIGEGGSLQNPKEGSAKHYNDQILELVGDSEILKDLKDLSLGNLFFEDIINANEEIYEEIKIEKELSEKWIDLTNPGKYSISQLTASFYYFISMNDTTSADIIISAINNRIKSLNDKQIKKIEGHLETFIRVKDKLNSVDVQKEEEQADKSFGELWAELNRYNDIKNMIEGDNAIYAELEGYVSDYNGVTGKNGNADEPSRLEFIQEAFDRFKEFIAFTKNFPESIRNELYINEYILANFGITDPYRLSDENSYAYTTKQANYIVYGYPVAGLNYFMFIKDIALIMFVANLLEQGLQGGFTNLAAFFKSLWTALQQTLDDIIELTNTNFLEWEPFKKFGGGKFVVTMPMFLRIIMAMKSFDPQFNDEKLRRLQAVVTKETSVNLIDRPSYIEGNVEGKVRLLFIPQLMEVLPGKVEGTDYIINKRKVFSY